MKLPANYVKAVGGQSKAERIYKRGLGATMVLGRVQRFLRINGRWVD